MTIFLSDRQIIEISGSDRYQFLQGLITNDIFQLKKNKNLLYSAMLSAKGRFLYDFFIFKDINDEKIYLDCFYQRTEEIIKKLSIYKLKSDITITKNDQILAFWQKNAEKQQKTFDNNSFYGILDDPRSKKMGQRLYVNHKIDYQDNVTIYHLTRILNKICEGEYDLTYDKSLILEFGFDNLNAISYNKGCYMGQELTARTHHMGQIRKKIYNIEIDNANQFLSSSELKSVANQSNLLKNIEITLMDSPVGIILSSVIIDNKILALALLKESINNVNSGFNNLLARNHPLKFL